MIGDAVLAAGGGLRKRRILVSAYGCEPYKGSEQGVGWHWVMELAKTAEVWVITRSNNRHAIESASLGSVVDSIRFVYYDLSERWRRFKRKEKGLYLYYAFWQWGAYKLARELNREWQFDFCQHLTFGSVWLPTFMYRLPIPFIWGPVGGGEAIPFPLISILPFRSRLAQFLRYFLIRFAIYNPLFRAPAQAACSIIVRTEDTARIFPEKSKSKINVVLETGVSVEETCAFENREKTFSQAAVRLIYTGRLIGSKNVEMGLHAFSIAIGMGCSLHLTIVGNGPSRRSLAQLAESLGISKQVDFVGSVSQRDVIALLKESDVFLFPSLKEGGSWSLVEAMCVGLPVICIDGSGMHVITDEECAFRISPGKPEQMVRRMAAAIVTLANGAELRERMGAHSRQRIEENFLWRQKGEFMCKLFEKLEAEQHQARHQ
jgi:glycosyltransferase involved in cell wall biosynthesis